MHKGEVMNWGRSPSAPNGFFYNQTDRALSPHASESKQIGTACTKQWQICRALNA